jgi:hypothetical protein
VKNKKQQPLLFRNFKWFTLTLAISCLLFIYSMPRGISYSDYNIIRWTPFILIFFILSISVFATLILFTNQMKLSIGITAVTILIVGPTFGLFQSYKEKLELQKYGVWTKSVVIDKKHNTQKGSGPQDYLIKCRYTISGINHETLYHNDINNSHLIGDTIRIIYSSQFPKIYALDYEWKNK